MLSILIYLQLRPPFKPEIKGESDTTNFDPEFTTETPRLTPPSGDSGQYPSFNVAKYFAWRLLIPFLKGSCLQKQFRPRSFEQRATKFRANLKRSMRISDEGFLLRKMSTLEVEFLSKVYFQFAQTFFAQMKMCLKRRKAITLRVIAKVEYFKSKASYQLC